MEAFKQEKITVKKIKQHLEKVENLIQFLARQSKEF